MITVTGGTFLEVKEILDDIRRFKKETEIFRRSADNHQQQIDKAQEQIHKGKEQIEYLMKKNSVLKDSFEEERQKINEAGKFWQTTIGFNLKPLYPSQLNKEDSKKPTKLPEHYDFEYKIDDKVYVVEVKLHDNHVRIPSHSPAFLTSGDIVNLELQLNKECINRVISTKGDEEMTIDWRMVIITLWRTLINKVNTSSN